jgi:hypothetical protein
MDKFGIIKNGLTQVDINDWKNVYQKVTSTNTNEGDPCWGIDINCLAYNWFTKQVMPLIKKNFTNDVELIFSSFIRLHNPIQIHKDIKEIPNNASGTHYRSILFPYSVDGDVKNFKNASTRFYDDNKDLIGTIVWEPDSIIWWDSEVLHDSGDFTKFDVKYKEYIITHTYV